MLKKVMSIFNKMFGDEEFCNECDDISSEKLCCCNFEDCNKPCVPRADYWKDQSRVELNKLALSILRESLRNDEGYYMSWKANIAMAFYDEYCNYFEENKEEKKTVIHVIANEAANTFLQNLLYNIENN